MSCSCQSSRTVQQADDKGSAAAPAGRHPAALLKPPGYMAHRVHPDESCIFCALKHVSTAHTLMSASSSVVAVIGELELARRHTLLEFSGEARLLGQAELALCLKDTALATRHMEAAWSAVQARSENVDGSSEQDNPRFGDTVDMAVPCPLVGEIHVGAAWRLATEIGYMGLNKSMIIGDLALAQVHLVRFDPRLEPFIRDLRHRIETTLASDLSVDWPALAGMVSRLVDSNLEKWSTDYSGGLRLYLGLGAEEL